MSELDFVACGTTFKGWRESDARIPSSGTTTFVRSVARVSIFAPRSSQKRTILFAEQLTEKVLLDLPHRQFVFTLPKALRVFFRHDRRLFEDISRLIFNLVCEFYQEVAGQIVARRNRLRTD